MNVGNVSFGARLDQSTVSFINTAKEMGLNTKTLAAKMKRCPGDVIETSLVKDSSGNVVGIYSMGIGESISKFFSGDMIVEPKIVINKNNAYVWKVYKITQRFLNTIEKSIENIRRS